MCLDMAIDFQEMNAEEDGCFFEILCIYYMPKVIIGQ